MWSRRSPAASGLRRGRARVLLHEGCALRRIALLLGMPAGAAASIARTKTSGIPILPQYCRNDPRVTVRVAADTIGLWPPSLCVHRQLGLRRSPGLRADPYQRLFFSSFLPTTSDVARVPMLIHRGLHSAWSLQPIVKSQAKYANHSDGGGYGFVLSSIRKN